MKPKKKKLKWHRTNAGIIKKLRQIAAAERKKKADAQFVETLRQMLEFWRAASIIRQANDEVTQIQTGARNPQLRVVQKTGVGHYTVRELIEIKKAEIKEAKARKAFFDTFFG